MGSYISVTPDLLKALEKIMHSALRGTHLLFSNTMIREAYERELPLDILSDSELSKQVQEALADLIRIPRLTERQEYIESLKQNVRDILVHLYFGFLDRFLDEGRSPEVLH